LRNALVIAVVAAVVPVATRGIDGPVAILIAESKCLRITILIDIIVVTDFEVAGIALGVIVVTIVSQRVSV
jgi:hypothetical protein